jgi:hypothetical protein
MWTHRWIALLSLLTLAAEAPAMAAEAPQPYASPIALRSVLPGTSLKLDSTLATSSTTAGTATSAVGLLSASYRFAPEWSAFARAGFVSLTRSPVGTGSAVSDLALGALWGRGFGDFRLAATASMTLPTASGGGDSPDPITRAAIRSAALARASLDNAMFGPNDLGLSAGADAAFLWHRFTFQGELTGIESIRVRSQSSQPDAAKTNVVLGGFVGYSFLPQLSGGVELRYQRFLSTPAAVAADPTGALRDTLSAAVGARAHFKIGRLGLHPGASFALGLDDPLAGGRYRLFQIDLALTPL